MIKQGKVPEGVFCGICGKNSIVFDTWFGYFPCEDHKHLTPTEYSRGIEDENQSYGHGV